MTTRIITLADHPELIRFWQGLDGISVGTSDSAASFARYLERNPSSNFLVEREGRIVATALAAHDGRRGMLRHVAVSPEYRGQGIAQDLVDKCLTALAAEGIEKAYVIVFANNEAGLEFWKHLGWETSDEFTLMWRTTGE